MVTYIKLFVDYLDAVEPLDDAERGRLFTALLQYAQSGQAPALAGNERFLFPMMRAQMDRDAAAYQDVCEKRAENGRKGGRPPKNQPKENQKKQEVLQKASAFSKTQDEDEDKDQDKDNDKDKDKDAAAALPLSEGGDYVASPGQVREWAALYPQLDVPQQLRSMRAWLLAHPDKRRGRGAMAGFVAAWLKRELNPPARPAPPNREPPTPAALSAPPPGNLAQLWSFDLPDQL